MSCRSQISWKDKLLSALQVDETGCIFGIKTTTIETTQKANQCAGLKHSLESALGAIFTETEPGCFALNLTTSDVEPPTSEAKTVELYETQTFQIDPFETPTDTFTLPLLPDCKFDSVEEFELNGVTLQLNGTGADGYTATSTDTEVTITTNELHGEANDPCKGHAEIKVVKTCDVLTPIATNEPVEEQAFILAEVPETNLISFEIDGEVIAATTLTELQELLLAHEKVTKVVSTEAGLEVTGTFNAISVTTNKKTITGVAKRK